MKLPAILFAALLCATPAMADRHGGDHSHHGGGGEHRGHHGWGHRDRGGDIGSLIGGFIGGFIGSQLPQDQEPYWSDTNKLPLMPDPKLTPGVVVSWTAEELCTKPREPRAVTKDMKQEAFEEYGVMGWNQDPLCDPQEIHSWQKHQQRCEVDHLIPRELGGADDIKNLWPQSYTGPWNAVMKDMVEDKLHAEVCAGRVQLDQAQHDIATNWHTLFLKYFAENKNDPSPS